MLDETLRLTPSLYFLPRRATADTWVETADGRRTVHPARARTSCWTSGTRTGTRTTGASRSPAIRRSDFVPERWENLAAQGRGSKEMLHFGFGHGPRVCPGKHLGQLEVALVVGAFVKLFRFRAVNPETPPKPASPPSRADGTLVELELR